MLQSLLAANPQFLINADKFPEQVDFWLGLAIALTFQHPLDPCPVVQLYL